MYKGRSYELYNFSCTRVHKSSDEVSQFEPKHVAMAKLIKLVLRVTDLILLWNTH
jgi:hypothetical protein